MTLVTPVKISWQQTIYISYSLRYFLLCSMLEYWFLSIVLGTRAIQSIPLGSHDCWLYDMDHVSYFCCFGKYIMKYFGGNNVHTNNKYALISFSSAVIHESYSAYIYWFFKILFCHIKYAHDWQKQYFSKFLPPLIPFSTGALPNATGRVLWMLFAKKNLVFILKRSELLMNFIILLSCPSVQ